MISASPILTYEIYSQIDKKYVATMTRTASDNNLERLELKLDDTILLFRGHIERNNYRTLVTCKVTTIEKIRDRKFKVHVIPVGTSTAPLNEGFTLDREGYDGWLKLPLQE